MASEKELLNEIESAKKRLREEIKQKEKEADEKLDEILSKRKMQFCPRCGRKIGSRLDWAGKCLHDGCGELICSQCWADEGKRYCKNHEKDYRQREEVTKDDIKSLTLNYMEFVGDRLKKWRLDWNHEGFIRKTKASRQRKKYGEFEMVVYEKKFLSKKPKVRILVRPLTETYQEEINSVLESAEGEQGIYTNLVFVGGSASIIQKALRLACEFSNKKASLFVMDMESGKLNFNEKDALARKYSLWLDPAKMPVTFSSMLKEVAESVAGRKIVYAKKFGEQLGKSEDEAGAILRKSGLLEEVRGTNSFIIKDEQA